MEVHFLRELDFGEELLSRARRIGNGRIYPIGERSSEAIPGTQFLHSLIRKEGGMELVRARSVWKPAPA